MCTDCAIRKLYESFFVYLIIPSKWKKDVTLQELGRPILTFSESTDQTIKNFKHTC